MNSTEVTHARLAAWSKIPILFSITCGTSAVIQVFASSLEQQYFSYDPAAKITILLDMPPGFTLHTLETSRARSHYLIATTWSSCVEYWEDLWDLQPDVLLVNRTSPVDLADALIRVVQGTRYRVAPNINTSLTPLERRMLRSLAEGYSNEQIAKQLTLQLQTVKNTVGIIYQKLFVANRNEAVRYYWGIRHMSK